MPRCWREPFASSATRSPSDPQTKLRARLLPRSRGGFSTECNLLFFSRVRLLFFLLTISGPEHSVQPISGASMSARVLAASLFALIAVAAVSTLPKIDLSETPYDETDAPTVQAIVVTKAASSKCIPSGAVASPIRFEKTCNAQARIIFPYTNQSSDSRQFRESLSTLRC